jgi:hypothetical protein
MHKFTVSKRTATHADALAAVGAADLLSGFEPELASCGDRFEITLQRAAHPQKLGLSDPGFLYLLKAPKKPPKLTPLMIYELESARKSDRPDSVDVPVPAQDSERRMYSMIGRLKAEGGLNKLVIQYERMSAQEWTLKVWDGLNGQEDFCVKPLLVQLFNPHAARGYSLLKPTGTCRNDKSKNAWGEPFLEWLRYRGYFQACAGWFLGKDIRIFTAEPGKIPYRLYRSVMSAFRDLRLGGSAAKVDCRAVLGLARILIDQMHPYQQPANLIPRLSIAHYQNMGQANTLMAIQQLAIPDWFELRGPSDAALWRQALDEHDKALKKLSDTNSEHSAVIKQYRRSLQAQKESALEEFCLFLQDYGLLLFKTRAENQRWALPQFSITSTSVILNRHAIYRHILLSPGFQAISQALRSATVSAQAARHNNVRVHREPRFGVLPAIRRDATIGKAALAQTVAAFVQAYNTEGARYPLRLWKYSGVAEFELDNFMKVLNAAPSAGMVGALLCGIATCKRSEEAVEAPSLADLNLAVSV